MSDTIEPEHDLIKAKAAFGEWGLPVGLSPVRAYR
jgi:hypothetical protein